MIIVRSRFKGNRKTVGVIISERRTLTLKIYHSYPDYDSMIDCLNNDYNMNFDNIKLYRDMIGTVYFLLEKDKRYVFKLYRTFDADAAIQSTEIINYLRSNNFPAVRIIPTRQDKLYTKLEMPEGIRVGIMFEHIDGEEPNIEEDIFLIGKLTGKMHKLMEDYNQKLSELKKDHYIDQFVKIMREMFSDVSKIDKINKYGEELWNNIYNLPKGFCHGDLHTGNLLKTKDGNIIFLDFDISTYSYPIFDVATICDQTDFWTVKESDMEKTFDSFEKFYEGYSKERKLSELEQSAILDCIAIHHYELNGTIPKYRLPLEGNHWLNKSYFNAHYNWTMEWKNKQKRFSI